MFTLNSINKIAFVFNNGLLDSNTRSTYAEFRVFREDSTMNTVVMDNPVVGQFVFKRIPDTVEYSLTDMSVRECSAIIWHHMVKFVDDVIENPELLNKFIDENDASVNIRPIMQYPLPDKRFSVYIF